MSDDQHTDTVTSSDPKAPSALDDGMPIADERVSLGKGAGAWLLIFGAIILVGVLWYIGVF
ncbi:hypothetical protein [Fulvimarina sp. MAC3]|uniref:hypothetical protein n=1 Tax=Fulvimarina sp. MAC3 TaxID=3148887 RepID=UPI0031FBC029